MIMKRRRRRRRRKETLLLLWGKRSSDSLGSQTDPVRPSRKGWLEIR